ncbi:MAG: WD40 repeat domain-containing protein, partial [Planctomycetota bacterium]
LLSDDGASLLVDSGQAGMIRYTTPMLEPAGAVAPELGDIDGGTARVAGDLLILPNVRPGVVHLYNPGANETLHSIPLNNPGLNSAPFVSPDARLAAVTLPNENGIWMLDLTMPGDQSLTSLEGHASWVYQLAVSPDGSLLAAAEPEGDILLWDLRADRLLARLPRRTASTDAVLAHNMNTPLVFTNDGRSLAFGELDEHLTPGVTTLDLDSGARSWVSTGSRKATLDAVADMLPEGTPASLYHHAALLANGKLVQSHSPGGPGWQLIVRDPDAPDDRVTLGADSFTFAGVAAHPSRPEYASGEYRLVRIRDAETNEILHEIADGSSSKVYGLAYSPDGSRLAMGTEDGRVLIMETRFYTRIAQFRVPPKADPSERNYVFNLAWTPDGSRLITTGTNRLLIFESERPFVREHTRAAWERDLARAREWSDASDAARRVVAIESWIADQSTDATADTGLEIDQREGFDDGSL